jgi:hypothetical protein
LHDSELIDLVICSGESYKLIVNLDYIEDYQMEHSSKKSLVFSGCMKLIIDANLLVAPDSLRTGYEIEPSEILRDLKERYAKVGIPIPNHVKHFYLETNSNASTVNVIAESVSLEDLD